VSPCAAAEEGVAGGARHRVEPRRARHFRFASLSSAPAVVMIAGTICLPAFGVVDQRHYDPGDGYVRSKEETDPSCSGAGRCVAT